MNASADEAIETRRKPPAAGPREIESIVRLHVEEAVHLAWLRMQTVANSNASLGRICSLDERLSAHLDAVQLSPRSGSRACRESLADLDVGSIFVATVQAIQSADGEALSRVLALAEARRSLENGVAMAMGWGPVAHTRPLAERLAASSRGFHRRLAVAASTGGGPGFRDRLRALAGDGDPSVRARALQAVAAGGALELLPSCMEALADADQACRVAAAHAALLLGRRGDLPDFLFGQCQASPSRWPDALALFFQLVDPADSARRLKMLVRGGLPERELIRLIGLNGDPAYVPWLIAKMAHPGFARIAADALAVITGEEVADGELEGTAPDEAHAEPEHEQGDEADSDPEGALPWPDRPKIAAWWLENQARFRGGSRYFMGAAPTWEHCIDVLGKRGQRRRVVAARYLCLLRPGTALIDCHGPSWLQVQWLGQLARPGEPAR